MESLSYATPLLVCPTAGDQFDNARTAARPRVGLWVDRPDPDCGGEADAAAAYRSEVAAKLRLLLEPSAPFKKAAQCQADALASAGGVPRAAQVVLRASERRPPVDA